MIDDDYLNYLAGHDPEAWLAMKSAMELDTETKIEPTAPAVKRDFNGFVVYVVDTETTGFDDRLNDVIEISMYRLNDDTQKTWCLKPLNNDTIEAGALRVNGHKLEDLKHETKFGRETYLAPPKVLIDIENWMMEDGVTSEDRLLIGQNVSFDKGFLKELWKKCDSAGTFPFGRKMMDTIQIVILMDLAKGVKRKGYTLGSLADDFGVKKEKAHRADADTRMTKELWLKQIAFFQELLKDVKIPGID